MKIVRVYFNTVIIALGHKTSVDSSTHKIETNDVGCLINDVILVPYSNCKEILLDRVLVDIQKLKKKAA